jgi:hypothetical protein
MREECDVLVAHERREPVAVEERQPGFMGWYDSHLKGDAKKGAATATAGPND